MQGIPDSKRHPFILSNSEENHTLINDLDEFDMNVSNLRKRVKLTLIKTHLSIMIILKIWDLHILVEYLADYCLPAFPTISHVSPSLFPLLAVFLILRAQQSYLYENAHYMP